MVAELFERCYLGADGYEIAKDFDLRGPILDGGATRARGLEADKNHQVVGIGKSLRQMMQNPAASDHPARRNNDRRIVALVNLLRLLGGLRKGEARPLDGRAVFPDQIGCLRSTRLNSSHLGISY